MYAELQHGFRLGDFVIHPLAGRIDGPSDAEHVQPKVMEVLVCLAEHPASLVERDDLLRAVWGSTNVADDVLTRCISELRHHLDDHPDQPRYVQTVPKRGYRLIADVQKLDGTEFVPGRADVSQQELPARGSNEGGSLFADLKRRRVVRVTVAYAIVAWLIIQVADSTFPALRLPEWSLTLVVVLMILGFPIAIALSWVFQVTPDGVMFDTRDSDASSGGRRVYVALVALVIAVTGTMIFRSISETDPGIDIDSMIEADEDFAVTNTASLGVLRFQNIGEDPSSQYFSDGLGEQVLTFLSNFTEFRVAARTSSWPLSDRGMDIPAIASQLQVGHVLEGSVQRNADNIRIWAQLVTDEGFHVWSQTYDRELSVENIFEIQDEIAQSVVNSLKVVLSDKSEDRFGERPTKILAALDLFLKGREYLRGVHNDERLTAAIDLFGEAIEADPDFAAARANLCIAHLFFYELSSSVEHFEAAEKSCHRAITRDRSEEIAYTALGSLYRRSGQLDTAEEYLTKAIELEPRSGEAIYALARTREGMNDLESARQLLGRAVSLQPGYWFTHNTMGTFLQRNGAPADALPYFRRVIELVPNRAVGYVNLAAAHSPLGEYQNALELYRKSLEIEPTRAAHTNIGLTYYRLHEFEKAANQQRLAIEMAPQDHRAWGRMGDAIRHAGDKEAATVAYENALQLVDVAFEINPSSPAYMAARARYLACLDRKDDIGGDLTRALELAPSSPAIHSLAAKVYLMLGDRERAVGLLQTAIQLGESPYYLASDPDLAALKDIDNFVALLPGEVAAE